MNTILGIIFFVKISLVAGDPYIMELMWSESDCRQLQYVIERNLNPKPPSEILYENIYEYLPEYQPRNLKDNLKIVRDLGVEREGEVSKSIFYSLIN